MDEEQDINKMKIVKSIVCILCFSVIVVISCLLCGCTGGMGDTGSGGKGDPGGADRTERADKNSNEPGLLSSEKDIDLRDTDGGGENYLFDYNGKEFKAKFSDGCWTIFDSYKIINGKDLVIICRALNSIHPVHGSDLESYRTPEDMAYEWEQHNIAYVILPKDDPWREHAKDVDIDPEDQGRSFEEIYEDRTGKKLELW